MPLLIAAIGIVLLVAALRGSTQTLFELIHNDFTGQGNFLVWLGAILGLGLFGYIKPIRPIAAGFLTLVIVALVLSNKGFFANFANAFQATQNTPKKNITTDQGGAGDATQSGSSGGQLSQLQPFQDFGNLFGNNSNSDSGNSLGSDIKNLFGSSNDLQSAATDLVGFLF